MNISFNFGNNILNKKIILKNFKTAMQNTPVLQTEDYIDVAAAVVLILGACARQMYRHFMLFISRYLVAILGVKNIQKFCEK